MNNRCYYYGVGALHNDESSVDGGKCIRLPLMKELIACNVDIHWIGFERNEQVNNHYIKLLDLNKYDWLTDLRNSVNNMHNLVMNEDKTSVDRDTLNCILKKEPGFLFIELRPDFDKPGYNFKTEFNIQCELIEEFIDRGLPVFVWDQDVWCQHLPESFRDKIVLLRSYFEPAEGFKHQELFLFGISNLPLNEGGRWKLENMSYADKIFDVNYCGNVYGRRDEFFEFFKPFHDNDKTVCVQGNWLRKKYNDRDFSLDNFPNFMFFGKTPHWTTIPTIAMAKSVIHFSNKEQQQVGLPTARIYEAYMGNSVIFCFDKIKHIDQLVPEQLIYSTADELYEKWTMFDNDKQNGWKKARNFFKQKIDVYENSYKHRAKQLLSFIEMYYR